MLALRPHTSSRACQLACARVPQRSSPVVILGVGLGAAYQGAHAAQAQGQQLSTLLINPLLHTPTRIRMMTAPSLPCSPYWTACVLLSTLTAHTFIESGGLMTSPFITPSTRRIQFITRSSKNSRICPNIWTGRMAQNELALTAGPGRAPAWFCNPSARLQMVGPSWSCNPRTRAAARLYSQC